MASQYFLLDRQLKIAFMYNCHTTGEMLSPIGILWYKYDALPKYGSIPQYFLELSVNLSEWNASFKSSTDSTSHLELPSNVNVSFNSGLARLFLAILIFRCLKSVTTFLSWVTFWLTNMTGLNRMKSLLSEFLSSITISFLCPKLPCPLL